MPGQRRQALLDAYVIATKHYAEAVSEFRRRRPTVPRAKYEELKEVVATALSECVRARRALEDTRLGRFSV